MQLACLCLNAKCKKALPPDLELPTRQHYGAGTVAYKTRGKKHSRLEYDQTAQAIYHDAINMLFQELPNRRTCL